MIFERMHLDGFGSHVSLDAYISDPIRGFTRRAMLVIPGGGYGAVCNDREGEPIAQAFISHGYNTFVLHYSVNGDGVHFPEQIIEASAAIRHIKNNAEKYNIDPTAVFAVGFSAGGHLAACLGTLWGMREIYERVDMPFGYNKPAGVILAYPVVTGRDGVAHEDSVKNLFGVENPDGAMRDEMSIELHVDKDSSPAFMVHTSDDALVNVKNSLLLASAYRDAEVLFELHVYPHAPHGIALSNAITECGMPEWNNPRYSKWISEAAAWAEEIIKSGKAVGAQ